MSKAAELANLIGNINAGGGGVNRNLVINGNFVVAQRGTSFSNVTSSQFCLDRFSVDVSGGGAFNVTQDTSAPEGFEKSLKLEVNTADSSIAVGDAYRITQAIEGQNIAQVDLGASTAKPMALSFYVKSSVTGTYGVGLANSAETENFVAEYTISSANTWEKKTINIPVRTSGTWLTTNGIGIGVRFDLGSGTNYNGTAGQWQTTSSKVYRTSSCVNLIATGSATWFLTGVQLEVGQNPTEFEHQKFSQTLQQCERYYQNSFETSAGNFPGVSTSNDNCIIVTSWNDGNCPFGNFRESMRTNPTVVLRERNGTTTGKITTNGSQKTATATDISEKGVGYISVSSGVNLVYNAFSYELKAEL